MMSYRLIAPLVVLTAAFLQGCDPVEAPLPDPFIEVDVTGDLQSSVAGLPGLRAHDAHHEGYDVALFAAVTDGFYQFVHVWGQTGGRIRTGSHALTPWGEGTPGSRFHATFHRESPGGGIQFHAASGSLRITRVTSEGLTGEFTFEGVEGILLPDRILWAESPNTVRVDGAFSVLCPENYPSCP